ncbi:MAG: biopolymer transporter ExbD [Spirochaetes bacterium]|nr:biopolymer transporter ExbD [Spirochaetota bacterium]
MRVQRKKRRRPIVPISAMSDIAFLLLIFIMLISLINYRREIPIQYPEAEKLETTQSEKNLEIWVDRSGGLYVQGVRYDRSGIEGIVAEGIMRNPSLRIHILADRDTPYKNVHTVMEILQTLQHRVVSLVVRDRRAE